MNKNNEWKVKQSIIDCEWRGRGQCWQRQPWLQKICSIMTLNSAVEVFLFCLMNVDSSFLDQLTVKTNFHLDLTLPSCFTFDHFKMEKNVSLKVVQRHSRTHLVELTNDDKKMNRTFCWVNEKHILPETLDDGVCFQINFILENVRLSSD